VTGLLDGVRVVDLSRVLAGPFAAQILAEMGADVIKVEPPEGDSARGIGPFINGRSMYFSSLNTNKRGVVLDLRTAAGRRSLDALLATADIVVENYRPAAAAKLELTPEVLLESHPQLVVATISGFGRGSQRESEAAYDLVAQAEAGIMSVTGEPGGAPVRAGVAISDLAAGLWGALGALAGYTRRLRDGHGSHVEVPLLDAALSLLTYVATDAMATGRGPDPVGSGHQNIVPYRAFATSDGWVVIAALGDKFWPMLCDVLGLGDMAEREDLRTNDQRTTSRAVVDAAIEEAIARLSTAEALRRLTEGGIPNAPINSMIDALGTPYVKEQGLVREVASPEGPYHVVQGPLRDGRQPHPAPALGEHTAEILREVLPADSPDLEDILNGRG
jgi:crotonobetainyl-CoA:carnitine CoA-transferase CaiB-like acyl-CoA transferase